LSALPLNPEPAAPSPADPKLPLAETATAFYTISVRGLCEFTAKRGDLDRRFTPSATALEGIRSQQQAAARRGADYETEISLETVCRGLRVRGRADGWDPRRQTLEEFKAIRGHPDEQPENRRQLHWAQLVTYAALFCRQRQLDELAVALVYVDVASQDEVSMRQVFGAAELDQILDARCADFTAWARQEAAHRHARDAALQQLAFPLPNFRPGQRLLAATVYSAAKRNQCLLAQAPTGIGKTLGALYPLLRGMPDNGVDKLAFLTCKGTGRQVALEAWRLLREGLSGASADESEASAQNSRGALGAKPEAAPLRVLVMVPKEQACEYPGQACHPQACPLAAGFFDKLPAARAQAVAEGWLDAAAQRRIALQHGLCPYHLGQELVRWADGLVGDVHHFFDPGGQLWALQQTRDWRLAILVDEAHNLAERVRQMYSGEVTLAGLLQAAQQAPASVAAALRRLAQASRALAEETEPVTPADDQAAATTGDADAAAAVTVQTVGDLSGPPAAVKTAAYRVLPEAPQAWSETLSHTVFSLSDYVHQHPVAQGEWLDIHHNLQQMQRLLESLGPHSLLDVQLEPSDISSTTAPALATAAAADALEALNTRPHAPSVTISVRNVVPAGFLRPRLAALQHATLMSATIGPFAHAKALLGLPDNTRTLDVPPAFPPEHLTVQVARGLSTRFADRPRTLGRLTGLLARQYDAHPGNYLAFFSSFDYLALAAQALAQARPDIPLWRQARQMSASERQAFLARFEPQGQGIGLAVLGGVFAEGVDLPGARLVGAFIATLGLPPVTPIQQAMTERARQVLGDSHGSPELISAMQKVVQAAGRVLRTPEDRGWLWLLDERYARPEIRRLLPGWWQPLRAVP
jgi:Rad3-related DNA helicase